MSLFIVVIFCVLQTFQRQVHEGLTQLELINKQYQRLARENRTDAACSLREMVQNANQRWDNLQKRVASVLRRLKVRQNFSTSADCHKYHNTTSIICKMIKL